MGAVIPVPVGVASVSGSAVSGSAVGTGGSAPPVATGQVTIAMPTSVDEIDMGTDRGAAYQGTAPHTHYGAAVYFDSDQYLYTVVNGIGVDPGVAGTAHAVTLTGTAPFTATQWATAAETVISAAGRTVSRSTSTLEVTVASPSRAATAAANQAALTTFASRGGGGVIGATQEDTASSGAGNGQSWIQVLPADVPSGAFRVIAFGIRRGSNVANGIRMALASGGTTDGDPEAAVVDHDRTMGDSGANNWHYEYLSTPVEYSGGERIWLGVHGDGAASSLFQGAGINDGTYQDGSTNLWLTDGTTGSTTATVSPVGAVTSSFNFGVAIRIVIQEAPYQTDGAYRVIGGAVPGVHDQDLFSGGTDVDQIFVGWRIVPPTIDDLYLMDFGVRLPAHASGASNQLRFEWWDAAGGAATFVGDALLQHIGNTADDQGTGWSLLGITPFAVTGGTTYRWSVKGEPAPGAESDTALDVWLGTDGADDVDLAGHPSAYAPSGTNIPGSEREVLANNPSNTDETALDFDPSVATTSPNNANGTIESPNNLPMNSLYFGKYAPTVTDTTT